MKGNGIPVTKFKQLSFDHVKHGIGFGPARDEGDPTTIDSWK